MLNTSLVSACVNEMDVRRLSQAHCGLISEGDAAHGGGTISPGPASTVRACPLCLLGLPSLSDRTGSLTDRHEAQYHLHLPLAAIESNGPSHCGITESCSS